VCKRLQREVERHARELEASGTTGAHDDDAADAAADALVTMASLGGARPDVQWQVVTLHQRLLLAGRTTAAAGAGVMSADKVNATLIGYAKDNPQIPRWLAAARAIDGAGVRRRGEIEYWTTQQLSERTIWPEDVPRQP
jgi:hypothetical protein